MEYYYIVTGRRDFGRIGLCHRWELEPTTMVSSHDFTPTPENYDEIASIMLSDDSALCCGAETEYVCYLSHPKAMRRWVRLSFGEYPMPKDMPEEVAVVFAEALWYAVLMKHIGAHPIVLEGMFTGALDDKPTFSDHDWGYFHDFGKRHGLDYQMEALSAGVPLEYILG